MIIMEFRYILRLVATTGLLEEQSSSQGTGGGSGRSWARQGEEVGLPGEGGEGQREEGDLSW